MTISGWPCWARRRASRSTALTGRERAPPLTDGMMQYAQRQSQPSWTFTKPRVRFAAMPCSGSTPGSMQAGPAVPACRVVAAGADQLHADGISAGVERCR